MGHRYDSDNQGFGMSLIKKTPSDILDPHDGEDMDFSQLSDKQRMSLMIEELG